MTQDAKIGSQLAMPQAQVEPDVQVVTYDQPPEAQAIPITEGHYADNGYQQAPPKHQSAQMADTGCDVMLCGDTHVRRLGTGNNYFVSLCGQTHIDVRENRLPSGSSVTVFVGRLCGDVTLLVPPGTVVVVRRIMLCGNRDIQVDDDPNQALEPLTRITVNVVSLCGNVRVRSNMQDFE